MKHYTMKTNRGSEGVAPPLLTLALFGGEWSSSCPSHFIPGERAAGTHWIGGWVGLGASLDNVEKGKFLPLPGLELWFLGRPAHSQSPYRILTVLSQIWQQRFIVLLWLVPKEAINSADLRFELTEAVSKGSIGQRLWHQILLPHRSALSYV
jgi:hypothetical protein